MRDLRGLAWRSLTARPVRTGLTIAGIALGVAVLFAGLTTNAGIDAAADRTVASTVGRADLRISAFGETGLGPETIEAIAATPGVTVVAPALERRTYLGAATSSGDLPPSVTVLGIDPAVESQLHDTTLIAGSPLGGSDEPRALISERLATQDRLSIGSEMTVLGAGEPADYRVVGIFAGDGPAGDPAGRTVVVPLRTAQAVFDQAGITRIDIGIAPGADAEAVQRELEDRLLIEPYVLATPRDLADSLRASTDDFSATTALIAAIALFTGAFLIYNTLSMTVIERVREIGLLRAAGATRGQIRTFILVQALVVGVIGSLVGLALGALMAAAMVAYLRTIGSVSLDGPDLAPATALVALVVGIAVTLAAAVEPAWRASHIPAVEALRARAEPFSARRGRTRWLAIVFAGVAVFGLTLWPRSAGSAGALRALAVYALLLTATLLIPFVMPALARIGGLPFRLPLPLEERLARATLIRDRGRATLTVGALAVGLALVVALGGLGQHARSVAGAWITDVVPGDVLVTSIRPIAADEGIDDDLSALSGVARVSAIATFEMAVNGVATDGAALVGSDLAADGRLTILSGDRAEALAALDGGGTTIVPAALADRLGITIDDTVSVTTVEGDTLPLRVVGIADRTLPGRAGESMLVSWADATNHLGVAGADAFAVRFAPGAPPSTRDALREAAGVAALEVVPLARVQGAIDDALDRVFGLFDALAVIAVIVAALGIANTLTMNVMERVREIGILRAAGMTRRQVWRSIVVEAGVVGVAGSLLGVVFGLAAGGLMVVLAGGRLDPGAFVPWGTVALAVVLGVALAMLAAAYPARLAARISIPRAVAYE